jgi:hypothetical protein
MPDRSGWIAKSRVTIWRWNDFESIALQVKPQIETHFELHWVPGITHSVRLAVPNEKIQFTGGSHGAKVCAACRYQFSSTRKAMRRQTRILAPLMPVLHP